MKQVTRYSVILLTSFFFASCLSQAAFVERPVLQGEHNITSAQSLCSVQLMHKDAAQKHPVDGWGEFIATYAGHGWIRLDQRLLEILQRSPSTELRAAVALKQAVAGHSAFEGIIKQLPRDGSSNYVLAVDYFSVSIETRTETDTAGDTTKIEHTKKRRYMKDLTIPSQSIEMAYVYLTKSNLATLTPEIAEVLLELAYERRLASPDYIAEMNRRYEVEAAYRRERQRLAEADAWMGHLGDDPTK